MNEIISSLSLQAAHKTIDPNGPFTPDEFVNFSKKFSELIIQEMLGVLVQYHRDSFPEDSIDCFDRGYLAGLYTAQKAVKEHFGVDT